MNMAAKPPVIPELYTGEKSKDATLTVWPGCVSTSLEEPELPSDAYLKLTGLILPERLLH